MNYLSLFSGIGGGDLAMQHLLGFRCVGYLENNDRCQKLIRERIDYGMLDNASIYGDIRTFISEGYASVYQGMADVITGGFPCQPFSCAGRRRGEADERNLWPETFQCICNIRPKIIFLENVPAILTSGYFGTIIGNLAEIGYDCKWTCLSVSRIGGLLLRSRLFLLGIDNSFDGDGLSIRKKGGFECQSKKWGCQQTYIQDVETSWIMANGYGDRVVAGIPDFLDRIHGLGNAVCPQQAATAFKLLSR